MTTTGWSYQLHIPRKYAKENRRFSVYWAWNYPCEANRDVIELDNRYPTMTEIRRAEWPAYETEAYSEKLFLQGIEGKLELLHLGLMTFQRVVGEVTDRPVAVYQRVDQAGQQLPIDERILADTDTLMVFGLDNIVTEQEAAPEEIEALRTFLAREGNCLILGPHHDIGASDDLKEREIEYAHHGDPLIPRQMRCGRYTRSLMRGLGVPVQNQWGLRPATHPGTSKTVPLSITADLDHRGWLHGVSTFVFHKHLPHYAVTTDDPNAIHVLARQPIDTSKPHPFSEAGNREFNMFLWMPPKGDRAGDILVADSTLFIVPFDGDETFWKNLATK